MGIQLNECVSEQMSEWTEHKADLARLAPEPARAKAETASLAGGKSSFSSLHHTQLSALQQQPHQPLQRLFLNRVLLCAQNMVLMSQGLLLEADQQLLLVRPTQRGITQAVPHGQGRAPFGV